MYAHPAPFFGLIGTFRHNYTSLHPEIIGVPKFGVKETITKPIRTCLISAYIGQGLQLGEESHLLIGRPHIGEPFQSELEADLIAPVTGGRLLSLDMFRRIMR